MWYKLPKICSQKQNLTAHNHCSVSLILVKTWDELIRSISERGIDFLKSLSRTSITFPIPDLRKIVRFLDSRRDAPRQD